MRIRKRHVVLLPGLLAVLGNIVAKSIISFSINPEGFDGPPAFLIAAGSVLSVGLGILALLRGHKIGWWAICLGVIAVITYSLLFGE